MISDEERREVAERLRFCARETNGTGDFSMYLKYWVNADGEQEGNPFTVQANRKSAERTLEKLADLIDRPKAKREDVGNYWMCGHCGAFNRKDAVTSCFGVIPSRCCGNCGREWER